MTHEHIISSGYERVGVMLMVLVLLFTLIALAVRIYGWAVLRAESML